MGYSVLRHKDKEVARAEFTPADVEGHRQQIEEYVAWIMAQPLGEARCLVTGLENIEVGKHSDFYQAKAKQTKPQYKAFAIVGLSGLKKIILNYVSIFTGMPMKFFDNEAEALAWVVDKE